MIHRDDPFAVGGRDPVRRFRGRLAAGVTVATSGAGEARTGLTVSSLMVLEGDPGWALLVVGPTSDLWTVVADTGRLVIHVCGEGDRHLAEVFAGLRPSPGGLFASVETSESDWGPVIDRLPDRAFCTLKSREELGYGGVVTATIDRIEASDLTAPLVYYRGRFRSIG